MIGNSIFDTSLLVSHDLSNAKTVNDLFSSNKSFYSHFCSQLLIYDELVIPTHDFGIIPIIESWIGFDNLFELINSDSLKFVRRRGLLGYVGNGNAISTLLIQAGKNKPLPWWSDALFSDFERSAELQIMNSFKDSMNHKVNSLLEKVLSNSIELEYKNEDFIKNVAEETYTDILKSPFYRHYLFSMDPHLPQGTDLRWLPGVNASQTRFLNFQNEVHDPVDFLLLLSELNFNIFSSVIAFPNSDLFVPNGSEFFLEEKIRRVGFNKEIIEQFQELLDLKRIPDFRSGIEDESIYFSDFWKLRQSRAGSEFRHWLQSINETEYQNISQAYVDVISHLADPDRLPLKMFRFAITTAAGVLPGIGGLLGGIAAGAIDSFFVDKWLRGYSPNLFLDEMRKLTRN